MVEEEFALKKESKASLFSSYKRGKTFWNKKCSKIKMSGDRIGVVKEVISSKPSSFISFYFGSFFLPSNFFLHPINLKTNCLLFFFFLNNFQIIFFENFFWNMISKIHEICSRKHFLEPNFWKTFSKEEFSKNIFWKIPNV